MSKKVRSVYVQKPVPTEKWAMFMWSLQQMLFVFPMHFSTTFSCLAQKIPGFTRTSWQSFFTCCCKLLTSAECTQDFRCLHSQKFQRIKVRRPCRPLCPICCSRKIWFRCCLTVWRKWGGAPSCVTHMCCRWWRGTYSENTGKSFTRKKLWALHLLACQVRQLLLRVDHLRCPLRLWLTHIAAGIDFWTYVDWNVFAHLREY
jgi:hypothetical protein